MMIDFGQLGSQNEQEITALFLNYLPLEPLPMELANRLKTCVLVEVKNSLGRPSFSTAPLACSFAFPSTQRAGNWQRALLMLVTLVVVAVALLYITQLLGLFS